MPTSKIFLPDVNVLLATASRRHMHWEICSAWFDSLTTRCVMLCRVSQMGLLRLLTNQSVMGPDVLTSRDAWRVYRTLLADERVEFAPEPFSLEQHWKKLTDQARPNTKVWTDAYLAAFAETSGMRVVTLDRDFSSLAADALILTPASCKMN